MKKFTNIVNESSINKYKLGLDIHGVVDSMPDFFAFLSDAVIKNGGEVHVITGGAWDDELEKQLSKSGIKWTHHFSVYDHMLDNYPYEGEVQFSDGTIQKKFRNSDWDKIKANYCRDNNISLHIDDTLIYNNYFTTPFARLWTHSGKPKAPHKDVRHLD